MNNLVKLKVILLAFSIFFISASIAGERILPTPKPTATANPTPTPKPTPNEKVVSTQSSDGSALGNVSTLMMILLTLSLGLMFIRKEEV